MRLQEALALPGLAPGAARHLMQKLEGALGRARIAVRKAEIGIDDADQIELREMMALGDELGADDDVELAFGDAVEFLAQPLDRFHQVAGQHDAARVGKQRSRPLPAGARRRDRRRRTNPRRCIAGRSAAAASRSRNDGRRAAA